MPAQDFRPIERAANQAFEATPYATTWGMCVLDAAGVTTLEAGNYGSNERFPAGALSHLAVARALDLLPVDLAEMTSIVHAVDIVDAHLAGPSIFFPPDVEISRQVLSQGMLRWGDDSAAHALTRSIGGPQVVLDALKTDSELGTNVEIGRLLLPDPALQDVFYSGDILPREAAILFQQTLQNPSYSQAFSENVWSWRGLAANLQNRLSAILLAHPAEITTVHRLVQQAREKKTLSNAEAELIMTQRWPFSRYPGTGSQLARAAGSVAEISDYTVALLAHGWPEQKMPTAHESGIRHSHFQDIAATLGDLVWRLRR